MQHMYRNIPYMFDWWAETVVHLLLKSSMVEQSKGSSKILFIKVPLPRFESKRHKGFQPRDIVETKNLYAVVNGMVQLN